MTVAELIRELTDYKMDDEIEIMVGDTTCAIDRVAQSGYRRLPVIETTESEEWFAKEIGWVEVTE